jgi:hypothetical protein
LQSPPPKHARRPENPRPAVDGSDPLPEYQWAARPADKDDPHFSVRVCRAADVSVTW